MFVCFVLFSEWKENPEAKQKKNGKYFFSLTISLRVFNLLGLCSHFFFFLVEIGIENGQYTILFKCGKKCVDYIEHISEGI